MNKDFDVFNEFKGFGNPRGKVWFTGLEEGMEIKAEFFSAMIKKYKKGHYPFNDEESFSWTPVYDIISKIQSGPNRWREYRQSKLGKEDSEEFIMNLYPLGKKKLNKWPPLYSDKFGFENKSEYLRYSKTRRFKILWWFHQKLKPRITICHGKSGWDDFKELFKLKDSKADLSFEGFQVYKQQRIILTPFFWSPGMSNNKINQLRELIGDLKQ